MKTGQIIRRIMGAGGVLAAASFLFPVAAATDGTARLDTTLLDYNGSSMKHWTVVWVTTEGGQFIKTLRKQGPSSWTTSHWNSHCSAWVTARGGLNGSTAFDGYTSATANDYAGTNSPLIIYWNCRDGNNALVEDGNYKFWVQYAEDSGQGPYTSQGLLWTKGPQAATNTYPDQGANFANMKVIWNPAAPPAEPPAIVSAPPPSTGTVGVPYQYQCQARGTAPVGFYALNLPPGLHIATSGLISGIPALAGTFSTVIIATNGVPPNATQPVSITIHAIPPLIQIPRWSGRSLVLEAAGPPGGYCRLLTAGSPAVSPEGWSVVQTNLFNAQGQLRLTNEINPLLPSQFFRLQIP